MVGIKCDIILYRSVKLMENRFTTQGHFVKQMIFHISGYHPC